MNKAVLEPKVQNFLSENVVTKFYNVVVNSGLWSNHTMTRSRLSGPEGTVAQKGHMQITNVAAN